MALRRYKLGQLTEQCVDKNEDNLYGSDSVVRISVNKELAPTKANLKDVSLKSFIVVKPRSFVYAADTSRRGDKISLAYNSSSETYLASNFHIVFALTILGGNNFLRNTYSCISIEASLIAMQGCTPGALLESVSIIRI